MAGAPRIWEGVAGFDLVHNVVCLRRVVQPRVSGNFTAPTGAELGACRSRQEQVRCEKVVRCTPASYAGRARRRACERRAAAAS